MNCEQAQTIVNESNTDPESATWLEATKHISVCDECSAQLQFERQLSPWLTCPVQSNPELWNRVTERIATPARPALKLWMRPTTRKEKMKRNIITSTAAAAVLTIGFGLISQSASAATPKAKFIAMKKVVLASAKASRTINLKLNVTPKAADEATNWFLVDGKLIEPAENSFTFVSADQVNSTKGKKTDAHPIIVKDGMTPKTKANATWLSLDLNEAHYDSIKFGKSESQLVLSPKGKSDMRYIVQLDNKTCSPTYLTLQKNEKGHWDIVKGKQITFSVYLPLKK